MSSPAIQSFIKDQLCLVVEPSSAFSASIQGCLAALGVEPAHILTARRYADAARLITERKPRILVTEYEIDEQFGLALSELQESFIDPSERVVVVVTRNSADSVVAQAAEEQVDAFILKPFSAADFQQRIAAAIERKANPSPYMQKINAGKKLLLEKKLAEAVVSFDEAKAMNPSPALACYYAGQANLVQKNLAAAIKEFELGRKSDPMHYKCITGAFEAYMETKNYAPAYELARVIKNNFPLTPKRLSQAFMAGVFTQNFADFGEYFEKYTLLESRTPDLAKVGSMALFAAGRHFLEKGNLSTATSMFDMGATAAGRDSAYLERVIGLLLKSKAADAARSFLLKMPQSYIGTIGHGRLSFKVDAFLLPASEMIERGRKLIAQDDGDAEIFFTLVTMMVKEGKTTLAESVIAKAVAKHPEMRQPLYQMLEKNPR